MRRLAVLSLLIAAPGLVSVPSPAAAAAECQGREATIVGEPGSRVDGTDGPDVIVTNGAKYVYAGTGADLVCSTEMPVVSWVYAGVGDDSVVAGDNGYQRLRVDLGPGSDRFVGGAGRDFVSTFDPLDEPSRADDVATGGGNDVVRATREIGPATNDADRIDLGPGRDVLVLGDSGLASSASVRGGPGLDAISVDTTNGQDVDINVEARTITRDFSDPYLSAWDSFENYTIQAGRGIVSFRGSPMVDTLAVHSAHAVEAFMDRGNDVVRMPSNMRASLWGGRGRDGIVLEHKNSSGGAWIDLAREEAGTVLLHRRTYSEIDNFEDATAVGGVQPLVLGNDRANALVAGCGTVRGGGGADRIEENTPGYLRFPHPDACSDFLAKGGAGNDVLVGSDGPDLLLGGKGRDRAVGLKGRDRCVAEIERGCER